eukprot:2951825-Amphidinium_carterae.1
MPCRDEVLFMEVCAKEAEKVGLHVLFHEKPFAGINGSANVLYSYGEPVPRSSINPDLKLTTSLLAS